jgi:nucleotide-binding universal stress UspA family protein
VRAIAAKLMDDLVSELPGELAAHVEMGHVPTRIFELARHWHSDLIVIGRHGHAGLEGYLLGSVSKDIAQAAECDVLVAGVE